MSFNPIVALGHTYMVHFTGSSPQSLRLYLLNSKDLAVGTAATVSVATASEYIVIEKPADLEIEIAVTEEKTELDYKDEAGVVTQEVEVT